MSVTVPLVAIEPCVDKAEKTPQGEMEPKTNNVVHRTADLASFTQVTSGLCSRISPLQL